MQNYDAFRNHPFINAIAPNKKWTVSDKNKKPIDMYTLIHSNKITGALYTNELSLTSLDEAHNEIPLSINYAYYLDILNDHFIVLDVEKTCPDDIKKEIDKIPCLYKETSMSGKGMHIIFPMLKNLFDLYPDTKQKSVMKNKKGYYEILLAHYVTFTGRQLPYVSINQNPDISTFMKIYDYEAKNTIISNYERINVSSIPEMTSKRDIAVLNETLNLIHQPNGYTKIPTDFDNDYSRYEFSFLNWLYYQVCRNVIPNIVTITEFQNMKPYDNNELAWFLYKGAQEYLPYRKKHDTTRHGLPWLYDQAVEVVSRHQENKI